MANTTTSRMRDLKEFREKISNPEFMTDDVLIKIKPGSRDDTINVRLTHLPTKKSHKIKDIDKDNYYDRILLGLDILACKVCTIH